VVLDSIVSPEVRELRLTLKITNISGFTPVRCERSSYFLADRFAANRSFDLSGTYQIGEDHARSWMVAGTSGGNGSPRLTETIVLHRGVGISSTRK